MFASEAQVAMKHRLSPFQVKCQLESRMALEEDVVQTTLLGYSLVDV